ncbi:MAG: NUDIX hydrolase [Chloroflexi bacterium]|nr:NUDIX hydrolase [Chloroflexota bacterium]
MAEPKDREVRRAVAAAVRRDDGLVLAVLRPDDPGEELPGVWGLPAVTLRDGESPEDGVRRLGREKLGVELTPLRSTAEGEQRREGYTLRMMVYEASMAGAPSLPPRSASGGTRYVAIDWLPAASFREAAEAGSLCCRLFLALTPDLRSPLSRERERGRGSRESRSFTHPTRSSPPHARECPRLPQGADAK